MNILKKLLTALRGGAREVGEAVIDANAMRIYEQEIVDAKMHIDQAKESLTTVMAQEIQAKRDIKALQKKITEQENYAHQALDKNEEALALEVAGKIAILEQESEESNARLKILNEQVTNLKEQIREGEKMVADHERQIAMVKTTDSVQKATIAVTGNISSNTSQLKSAKDSLERIRKRQQETADKLKAGQILENEDSDKELDEKLKDAGIKPTHSGASVLERLKQSS